MNEIYIDNKLVAYIPDNLNTGSFIDLVKIYLINEEFAPWYEFKIVDPKNKKDPPQGSPPKKKVNK